MAFQKTLTQSGTGSTVPWIVDTWANPQTIGVNCTLTGSATFSLQGAYDDLKPQWDIVANPPTWVSVSSFNGLTSSTNGTIAGGPYTMLRLTVSAGTGSVTAKFVQAYAGRAT